MRIFIAIELPQKIKDHLSKLQQALKLTNADVKWVEPQKIHLTLKFLGEAGEIKLKQISDILDETAKISSSYSIRISELGAFPGIDYPRVIWVGIDHGDNQTKEIAAILEEKLSLIGMPKEEREFSTHITIGRVRSGKNRMKLINELKKSSSEFAGKGYETQISKITLFKSKFSPKGPVYEPITYHNLR